MTIILTDEGWSQNYGSDFHCSIHDCYVRRELGDVQIIRLEVLTQSHDGYKEES